MRRLLVPAVTAGLLALGACTAPAPGDAPAGGPVTSQTAGPTASPSPSPAPRASSTATATATSTPSSTPSSTDRRVEEQGDDDAGGGMTPFTRAHTYPDGVRVEVSRIRHGSITAADVRAGARLKKGTPWVQLTVRVDNGTKHRLRELVGDYELSSGPDKEPADPISVPGVRGHGLSGSIPAGGSATSSWTFSVPVADQDDVVLGFTPDIDHDTAYFAGSVR